MKKSSENSNKIIDKLYLKGEGEKSGELEVKETSFDESKEVEELRKALDCWRNNHFEEEPSPALRYRILKEAKKAGITFSWWRWFLIPIKKPAIGIAVCVLIIFGVVTYNYRFIKSPENISGEKKSPVSSKKAEKKEFDTLAMVGSETALEQSAKGDFTGEEHEEEDVMVAEKALEETSRDLVPGTIVDETNLQTRGDQLFDKNTNFSRRQGSVGDGQKRGIRDRELSIKASPSQQRRRISKTITSERERLQQKDHIKGADIGGHGKGYSDLPAEAPAGSHSRPKKKRIIDQPTVADDAKSVVLGESEKKSKKETQPDFFQKGILEQKRQNHVEAVKFFEKALKNAKDPNQKNRVLLKLAESEIKRGNKKKAKNILAEIKDRKGWVEKEAQRLERKAQARKAKKKPKQRKNTDSAQ